MLDLRKAGITWKQMGFAILWSFGSAGFYVQPASALYDAECARLQQQIALVERAPNQFASLRNLASGSNWKRAFSRGDNAIAKHVAANDRSLIERIQIENVAASTTFSTDMDAQNALREGLKRIAEGGSGVSIDRRRQTGGTGSIGFKYEVRFEMPASVGHGFVKAGNGTRRIAGIRHVTLVLVNDIFESNLLKVLTIYPDAFPSIP